MEEILPGLRILPKREPRSLASSPNVDLVGESVPSGVGAFCSSLESKKGNESSKESDFGLGIAPFTVAASSPCGISRDTRKSIASLSPPALLRVYARSSRSSLVSDSSAGFRSFRICESTSYWLFNLYCTSDLNSLVLKKSRSEAGAGITSS